VTTVTLGYSGTSGSFSGTIANGVNNTVSLVKTGSGTQTLNGANAYSGGTIVNAGTLLVNNTSGSGTGTGAVSVTAGTLGGIGTITGPVTIGNVPTGAATIDSYLAPGASIGTLIINNDLTVNSDATLLEEINTLSGDADKVVVNGNLTLNSPTLTLADLDANTIMQLGSQFVLVHYTGTWNGGTFQGYADDSSFWFGNNKFTIDYNFANPAGGFDVILTDLPEPASLALLGLALAGLAGYRWRRRRA
jgi:autotransporter-associated beta strand protein